jgi:hypothetical protein
MDSFTFKGTVKNQAIERGFSLGVNERWCTSLYDLYPFSRELSVLQARPVPAQAKSGSARYQLGSVPARLGTSSVLFRLVPVPSRAGSSSLLLFIFQSLGDILFNRSRLYVHTHRFSLSCLETNRTD